jgi:hypothetical protein
MITIRIWPLSGFTGGGKLQDKVPLDALIQAYKIMGT